MWAPNVATPLGLPLQWPLRPGTPGVRASCLCRGPGALRRLPCCLGRPRLCCGRLPGSCPASLGRLLLVLSLGGIERHGGEEGLLQPARVHLVALEDLDGPPLVAAEL